MAGSLGFRQERHCGAVKARSSRTQKRVLGELVVVIVVFGTAAIKQISVGLRVPLRSRIHDVELGRTHPHVAEVFLVI